MDDPINRQAAIEVIRHALCLDGFRGEGGCITKEHAIKLLTQLPAEPVRMKGKWIDSEPDRNSLRKSGMAFFCSNCHHSAGKHKHTTYKFCPWCGADMREEQT